MEDRFGARLIEVGFAAIRLVVARPPHTFDEALRIAAEHYAFCDESGMRGNKDVNLMANDILHAPIGICGGTSQAGETERKKKIIAAEYPGPRFPGTL